MNAVARAAVLGLAGLTAFGAAGCNRGGGSGGTTTIIQKPGGSGAGSSPASPSAAGVAPIDDPKELCHQIFIKTRGLSTALSAFWKIATKPGGWSYTDQDAQDAISRVQKEAEQVFPTLDNVVGQGVSSDVSGPANEYLKAMKEFSNAIAEQRTDNILNPDASSFGDAKDKLNSACGSAR